MSGLSLRAATGGNLDEVTPAATGRRLGGTKKGLANTAPAFSVAYNQRSDASEGSALGNARDAMKCHHARTPMRNKNGVSGTECSESTFRFVLGDGIPQLRKQLCNGLSVFV